MKPACAKCQRFYRPKRNGFSWIEGVPIETGAPPGMEAPEKWRPYKLWQSDLWECQGCGHQLITGHGRGPISEHYEPNFADQIVSWGAELQINDC
jgi:hypothetical protein